MSQEINSSSPESRDGLDEDAEALSEPCATILENRLVTYTQH